MAESVLLNGCSTWTLTKRTEKMLDGNYTRMLRSVFFNKSWEQHPTKHREDGHLSQNIPSKITKTSWTFLEKYLWRHWMQSEKLIKAIADSDKWRERQRERERKKAPFSIAATPRCRWGCYSIAWELLMLDCGAWNHLIVCKQMSSDLFEKLSY